MEQSSETEVRMIIQSHKNDPSKFSGKLHKYLTLNEQWRFAILEIAIPNAIKFINADEDFIRIERNIDNAQPQSPETPVEGISPSLEDLDTNPRNRRNIGNTHPRADKEITPPLAELDKNPRSRQKRSGNSYNFNINLSNYFPWVSRYLAVWSSNIRRLMRKMGNNRGWRRGVRLFGPTRAEYYKAATLHFYGIVGLPRSIPTEELNSTHEIFGGYNTDFLIKSGFARVRPILDSVYTDFESTIKNESWYLPCQRVAIQNNAVWKEIYKAVFQNNLLRFAKTIPGCTPAKFIGIIDETITKFHKYVGSVKTNTTITEVDNRILTVRELILAEILRPKRERIIHPEDYDDNGGESAATEDSEMSGEEELSLEIPDHPSADPDIASSSSSEAENEELSAGEGGKTLGQFGEAIIGEPDSVKTKVGGEENSEAGEESSDVINPGGESPTALKEGDTHLTEDENSELPNKQESNTRDSSEKSRVQYFNIKLIPNEAKTYPDIFNYHIRDELEERRMKGVKTEIRYDFCAHKATFVVPKNETVILNGRLPDIYSLPKKMVGPATFKSKYCVDPYIDYRTLLVYSDISQPISLGEGDHPLVQIIPLIFGSSDSCLHYVFENPIYLGLNRRHIKDFSLSIFNEIGHPVQLHTGSPIIIKLIFTKIKQ